VHCLPWLQAEYKILAGRLAQEKKTKQTFVPRAVEAQATTNDDDDDLISIVTFRGTNPAVQEEDCPCVGGSTLQPAEIPVSGSSPPLHSCPITRAMTPLASTGVRIRPPSPQQPTAAGVVPESEKRTMRKRKGRDAPIPDKGTVHLSTEKQTHEPAVQPDASAIPSTTLRRQLIIGKRSRNPDEDAIQADALIILPGKPAAKDKLAKGKSKSHDEPHNVGAASLNHRTKHAGVKSNKPTTRS